MWTSATAIIASSCCSTPGATTRGTRGGATGPGLTSWCQHRLPAMYSQREFAAAGGLMAYAANPGATYRTAATFVAKILNGARPAELPVEQPTKFDFAVNLKTA